MIQKIILQKSILDSLLSIHIFKTKINQSPFMKQRGQIIVAIIILLDFSLITHQQCLKRQTTMRSITRGKYKNSLHISNGALISSTKENFFYKNNSGNCLRDTIYEVSGQTGFMYCMPGFSIQLKLLQKYELNTLKLWIWDRDNRLQTLQLYVKVGNLETKVYETTMAQSVVTITFPDQFVEEFRIFNIAGNTNNPGLHLIKVEAYYKLQITLLQ
ncbi:unnamed protein product (macronuclear) [Paramecium tetraurelia]|uniref:F5/8 type C domain-containing protein n=1 Tax=Paramecium tetraurelia TaxID=5888 RepID=A0C9N1_PARTE|nr:uncharacterized protein GSPATT00006804001 [Paramecium tetraurelia]CAK67498.1 unnamed protein product [Paramecium tetraurelia]|eukprot:XP_001434895.1 hypothetical protein (macronuclear) [Paramecium tetraurelia strain d4-2]